MATYTPPDPFVFTITGGYSPPSPLVLVIVQDDGSRTADGVFAPPVESATGYGHSWKVGNGIVAPPIDDVSAVVSCVSGVVVPGVDGVVAEGVSYVSVASISPNIDDVVSTGESWAGDEISVRPRRDRAKAVGLSVANVATIGPRADIVAGAGTATTFADGIISAPTASVASNAVVALVLNNGRFFPRRDAFTVAGIVQPAGKIQLRPKTHTTSGQGSAVCVGACNVGLLIDEARGVAFSASVSSVLLTGRFPVVFAKGFAVTIGHVSIEPHGDKVAIFSGQIVHEALLFLRVSPAPAATFTPATNGLLAFTRDSSLPPAQIVTAAQPLQFNRAAREA